MDCSLAPKGRQLASSQQAGSAWRSARVWQPTEQPNTSENSSLMLPLSPAEFVDLKAQWLYETKRAGRSEDGFRYVAKAKLPGHLYEPLYRFNKEHDFSMATGLQYAVYSILKSHGF